MNTPSSNILSLPLYCGVQAGFPSPAENEVEAALDLNQLMIRHPIATFYVRVVGDSMEGAKIFEGDILIVDRAEEPADKKIVVAIVNGEFTVKKLIKKGNGVYLVAENKNYAPLKITPEMDFQVWGVVTWVLHQLH